jgi:hypothetical protein
MNSKRVKISYEGNGDEITQHPSNEQRTTLTPFQSLKPYLEDISDQGDWSRIHKTQLKFQNNKDKIEDFIEKVIYKEMDAPVEDELEMMNWVLKTLIQSDHMVWLTFLNYDMAANIIFIDWFKNVLNFLLTNADNDGSTSSSSWEEGEVDFQALSRAAERVLFFMFSFATRFVLAFEWNARRRELLRGSFDFDWKDMAEKAIKEICDSKKIFGNKQWPRLRQAAVSCLWALHQHLGLPQSEYCVLDADEESETSQAQQTMINTHNARLIREELDHQKAMQLRQDSQLEEGFVSVDNNQYGFCCTRCRCDTSNATKTLHEAETKDDVSDMNLFCFCVPFCFSYSTASHRSLQII